MRQLWWRFIFALTVRDIFSRPKGVFKGKHFLLGWRMSKEAKYRHLDAYDAALKEVSEWYD